MKTAKAGFLLLELLITISLLSLSVSFLYLNYQSWLHSYYKIQLQIAAQLLASDLRQLQARIMFHHIASTFHWLPAGDMRGYTISHDAPPVVLLRRNFAESYCSKVYLKNAPVLGFGFSGSPSSSGTIILGHEDLPQYFLQVELQPVTGRVLINEN